MNAEAAATPSVPEGAQITRQQARAFLGTLWPKGEYCHIENPTRTFLSALMGAYPVPSEFGLNLQAFNHKACERLAQILRELAAHIEMHDTDPVVLAAAKEEIADRLRRRETRTAPYDHRLSDLDDEDPF